VRFTGADVSWLADKSWRQDGAVPNLHLEGADLIEARLEGVDLFGAALGEAILDRTHLERANLAEAHLEHATLIRARLEGANLQYAWMDKATALNGAMLDRAVLDQLSFDGTNLAVVKWEAVRVLGDELNARTPKHEGSRRKDRETRLDDYEAAVRAHLQLSAVLRSQGMSEQADRFAYRAQVLQRTRFRLQRRLGAWLFSWVLFLLAGYGYRPARSFFWYLAVIAGFAIAYFSVGYTSGLIPGPLDAVVFSVTSFHGRGFFPNENIGLHHPLTVLAAIEAVIGLFIEISFIATFTQRYFGAR
jgi:hypothetical protein